MSVDRSKVGRLVGGPLPKIAGRLEQKRSQAVGGWLVLDAARSVGRSVGQSDSRIVGVGYPRVLPTGPLVTVKQPEANNWTKVSATDYPIPRTQATLL
jgi:hypothetical protein